MDGQQTARRGSGTDAWEDAPMTQAAPGSSPVNRRFRRAARWWLAAGAFVLGLLAGVVITGLLIQGPPSSVAGPTGVPGTTTSSETASTTGPSSMASPSSGASVQIVVNDACLRAINEAQDAYNAINKIGDAVRQFNLSTLDDIIRQLQPLQGALRNDVSACHVTARLPDGSLISTTLPQESTILATTPAPVSTATPTG